MEWVAAVSVITAAAGTAFGIYKYFARKKKEKRARKRGQDGERGGDDRRAERTE